MGGAEETGFAGIGPAHLPHFGSESDERRHFRSDGLVEFGKDGAKGRPTAGRRFGAAERASGHALISVVVRIGADNGSNDCQAIHDGGHFGKVFADLNAGNFGGNGFEFSSNFGRRLRFQVEHVLMRRASGQEDHNDRLVRAAVSGIGVGAEQVRQGQSAQSESSDFEKVAARNAVAKLRCVSRYSNHNSRFRFKRRSVGASIYFIKG